MELASIVGTIFDGMSGGVFGALTGILGAGVTSFFKQRQRKQDQAFEREMREYDQEDMRIEAELFIARDKAAAEVEISVSEMEAFNTSQKGAHDPLLKKEYMEGLHPILKGVIAFMLAIVDIINKTVRPAITYYFLYQTHKIVVKVMSQDSFSTAIATISVINVVLFLTVTAVTWWLGQRPMDKMMDKIIV